MVSECGVVRIMGVAGQWVCTSSCGVVRMMGVCGQQARVDGYRVVSEGQWVWPVSEG